MDGPQTRPIEAERIGELGRLLAAKGAEALLVLAEDSRDPDLAPFVGGSLLGRSVLLMSDGTPGLLCLTPMEREEAEATGLNLLDPAALGLAELETRSSDPNEFFAAAAHAALATMAPRASTVAIAGRAPAGVTLRLRDTLEDSWRALDGGELLRAWRRKKSREELADCRRAAGIAGLAMRRVAEMLAASVSRGDALWLEGERLTVGRLRGEVAVIAASHGLDQPHGNIIAPGRDGGVPHSHGDDNSVIPPRASVVVDLFPRSRLFADLTRTFCVGEPGADLLEAHRLVVEALEEAERHAAPGVRGWDLQRATCDRFSAAGYPTPITAPGTTRGYVHNLGHGVGYELHEVPSFRDNTAELGVLAAGDVITIEPGLYDPEAGYGVRIEDQLVVSDSGCERLVDLPFDLDPAAW